MFLQFSRACSSVSLILAEGSAKPTSVECLRLPFMQGHEESGLLTLSK